MSELEAQFENEMIERVYRTAGQETGYWASYFLRAVRQRGGVGAGSGTQRRRSVASASSIE